MEQKQNFKIVEHPWSDTSIYNQNDEPLALLSIAGRVTEDNQEELEVEQHKLANLFATAPELLDVLESVLERIEKSDEWWMDCPERGGFDAEKIKFTIAKAKGTV